MSQQAIAEKQKKVDELKDKIARSSLIVLSDYLGFTVKEITDLRKKLRTENSELRIVKNTLLERAVGQSGFDELKTQLKGSTALLLGYADPLSPLKLLVRFIKDSEKGALRAGVVDKKVYNESDLKAISKLPARAVLLSKVVGGLKSPISGLVNVLNGPLRKLVYVLKAVKKGGEK